MKQTELIEKIDRLMTMAAWPAAVTDSATEVIHALRCYGTLVAVRDFADWIGELEMVTTNGSANAGMRDALKLSDEIYYDTDGLMQRSGIEDAIMVI